MFSIIVLFAAFGAEPAAAGAATAGSMTLQQQFNAADRAAADGRCEEAVTAFEALEARPAVSSNANVLATVRARKAECLVKLWRLDEAAAASNHALAVLSADTSTSRADVADAHLQLGRVDYLRFEYDAAVPELEAASALMSGSERIEPLMWLARATMFAADERAITYADQALALAAADARWAAALPGLHSLHARALLNHGQQSAAYAELHKVLDQKGGLTTKVALDDLVIRADLALAALLNGDEDKAREYLAYTGAGRFKQKQLDHPISNGLPTCGGSAEIKPDDFAVVEFDIEDDGAVRHVSPVYASRTGPMAAQFARSVAAWSWDPADAQAIPRLFRLVTRVEVRCTAGPAHPDELDGLHAELTAWVKQRGLTPFSGDTRRASAVDLARSELARKQSVQPALDQVPVLLALASSPVTTNAESLQWFKQARDLIAAAGAPIGALTYIDIVSYRLVRPSDPARYRDYLRTLLASPAVAADARTAGTLRLLIAEPVYKLPPPADAKQLLETTIADPALPDPDPVKIASLLRLATQQATEKNFTAAEATYRKTGLSSQQCSMFDVKPAMRSNGATYLSFPDEAQRWGFSGWVMMELDIQANGKTANQRALIVYPPIVFADAAVRIAKDARYEMSYRPEGGLGCGGKQMYVNFSAWRN